MTSRILVSPECLPEISVTGFRWKPVRSDGWLISVFSVAVIILAILAALLVTRQGQKITGLTALGFTVFTN